MSASGQSAFAWEPLTPRGVAAFGRASLGRLLLVQFIIAALSAASVCSFVAGSCFPVVGQAIRRLPSEGEIRAGQLDWRGPSPQLLAEGRLVAFVVDLDHSGQIRSSAQLQVEFGRQTVRVFWLPGYAEFHYPAGWIIAFNQPAIEPRWDAWAPELLALAGAAVVLDLLFAWAALATVYFLPAWLLGFFTNRDLTLRASWKLSGAALMPGALALAAALLLCNLGFFHLVTLSFIVAAHFVLGWIYLFVSLLFVPRNSAAAPRGNPFRVRRKT